MKTYDCRISLGKNIAATDPQHQVNKKNITRAEVVLLRSIHGADAVQEVKHVGINNAPDAQIYAELAEQYPKYPQMIEKLFGVQLQDFSAGLDASLEVGLDESDDAPAVAQSLRREAVRENVDMG